MNYAGSLLFVLFLFSTALTGHFWKYVGHGYSGKVCSLASAGPPTCKSNCAAVHSF